MIRAVVTAPLRLLSSLVSSHPQPSAAPPRPGGHRPAAADRALAGLNAPALQRRSLRDGPCSQTTADAVLLLPPKFVKSGDYAAWADRVRRHLRRASPAARANYYRLALEHGQALPKCDATTLNALLGMLPGHKIADLPLSGRHLGDLWLQNANTVLALGRSLRTHNPVGFACMVRSLHQDGTQAKASSPEQQAALDALFQFNLAEHAQEDLASWSKRIASASPRLARVLAKLGEACAAKAQHWSDPAARFAQVTKSIETPAPMRAALEPFLQAMLAHATPDEAVRRAKMTLRTVASPLATAEDLSQLQALPPELIAFLCGDPITPKCTPSALDGLSPLLRGWLLMAAYARLQHAPSTAEHRAFLEGCAAYGDRNCPEASLDWLELAQRMGAPLAPWVGLLPAAHTLRGRPTLQRCLARWTKVVVSGRFNAALWHPNPWTGEIYLNGDLASVLKLEAAVHAHLPNAYLHQRVLVFRRTDLAPNPAQQAVLDVMLERLPDEVLETHVSAVPPWKLAPLATRRWIGRTWLQAGRGKPERGLPSDMKTLRDCLNLQPVASAHLELRLLADTEAQVRSADWQALLDAHGDPPWLRALLASELPCVGLAAQAQANRLAALGRFLYICRVLGIPAAERDAVGDWVKQLLALPDVRARHRLLARLCAALLPGGDAAIRQDILALQKLPVPAKAIPLRLAMRFYLAPEVAQRPQVEAQLGTRSVYGDGSIVRQLLHLIIDERQPDYAVQVLSWATRENLTTMLEGLTARATQQQRGLFQAVSEALHKATHLDAAFYKQTCVRTFLHAHVLPVQRELITCAELVLAQGLDVTKLTCPADIYARGAEALGIAADAFERLQRSEPTARYALGFQSSQKHWGAFSADKEAPGVWRALVQACANDSTDAYRRQSPQAQWLLKRPGGADLLAKWEQLTPESLTWSAKAPEAPSSTWTISDTGHPTQQLACATEVHSCQSNTSHYGLNYGMLGRMACASKRTLTLRDERGTLRARAMLRIVRDDNDRPVLLLSQAYAAAGGSSREVGKAFGAYVARRAQGLGIAAVRSDDDNLGERTMRLHSLGAMPDYWDEADGIRTHFNQEVSVHVLARSKSLEPSPIGMPRRRYR